MTSAAAANTGAPPAVHADNGPPAAAGFQQAPVEQEFLELVPQEFARRHLILSEGTSPSLEDVTEGTRGPCQPRTPTPTIDPSALDPPLDSEPPLDGVPAATTAGTVTERLLIAPSTRRAAVFNVSVRLGRPVTTRVGDPEVIAAAIDAAYTRAHSRRNAHQSGDSLGGGIPLDIPAVVVEGSSDVAGDLAAAVRAAENDLLSTTGKAPVVRLVDLILFEALLRGASDVHIQPVGGGASGREGGDSRGAGGGGGGGGDRTLVRFRLDGSLHTVRDLPGSLASAVVSRIKVMARLDVAERRAPQDGRASVTVGGASASGKGVHAGEGNGGVAAGRRVDLRVSTLPSTYGERVVLRLLDPSRSPHLLSFAALGMPPEVESRYLAQVSRASGIVLSTGPTGSGKTTTLYATLAWLSSHHEDADASGGGGCELNMMTVEDPVEYDLSAIGAIMRSGDHSGHGSAGRGAISQTQVDPKKNVTFATGLRHILRQDPDVIMVGEIRDEETARMAVQASLTGHLVLSTLHTNDAAGAVARLLDLAVEPFLVASSLSAVLAQRLVRRVHAACSGKGCVECLGTGYKGRLGVFELLLVDSAIRGLINQRAPADRIKAAAQAGGMTTLRATGEALSARGLTTLTEVGRVIDLLDEEEVIP